MTNKERVELAKALIYIGVSDREIVRRFRDFDDFSEVKTRQQLTNLRNRRMK
jgi:hypothetical protein